MLVLCGPSKTGKTMWARQCPGPQRHSGIVGASLMFNIPGVHSFGIDEFQVVHFCECTLHTLDLGVAQRFSATAMVRALKIFNKNAI